MFGGNNQSLLIGCRVSARAALAQSRFQDIG
jgi:hypothetical protein